MSASVISGCVTIGSIWVLPGEKASGHDRGMTVPAEGSFPLTDALSVAIGKLVESALR